MSLEPGPERSLSEHDTAAAAATVQSRSGLRPRVGLILGSGLGDLADEAVSACEIPYAELAGHPVSTVAGHAGQLVLGEVAGTPVAIWRGRVHFYEGFGMPEVGFPVRLAHALGAEVLIVTNAAGGLRPTLAAGDLMLISDHINLPGLTGHSPLRGSQAPGLERFVDLAEAYDPDLRKLAHRVADEQGLALSEGVYAMVAGPSYETPAEARLLRQLGADAVGMSTAPEVVVARQLGLRVLGLSTITNAIGGPAAGGTSHLEVLEVAQRAKARLLPLLRGILKEIGEAARS